MPRLVYSLMRVSLLFSLLLPVILSAQSVTITGLVRDADSRDPLPGASVSIVGTDRGAITGPDGRFILVHISELRFLVRASFVGYTPLDLAVTPGSEDTVVLMFSLEPSGHETDEVVVTGTRTLRHISDVPVRIEAIPEEEVEEKLLMSPGSVAMLLNESTGMRIQTTSGMSGASELRIHGLSGRATKILVDGLPASGAVGTGFGLLQLPPIHIRQVEVIKGAASALYGADAVGGVVNFITKEPGDEPSISFLANKTSQGGLDGTTFISGTYEEVGLALLLSHHTQSRYDVNGDYFAEVAEYTRSVVAPRVFANITEALKVSVGLEGSEETRNAGYFGVSLAYDATPDLRSRIKTRRTGVTGHASWNLSDGMTLEAKGAWRTDQREEFVWGAAPRSGEFNGFTTMGIVDVQLSWITDRHRPLVGFALTTEDLDDRTIPVVPLAAPRASRPGGLSHRTEEWGLFLQDELVLADGWSAVASARVDRHSESGTFVTPRLSLLWKPTAVWTLRAGAGTGFFSPSMFTEEAEELGMASVYPISGLPTTRTVSGSLDVQHRWILGDVSGSVNVAVFVSRFERPIMADEDSMAAGSVWLRAATGPARTSGVEATVRGGWSDVSMSIGYTYTYAEREDAGVRAELPLNPRHSVGAVVMYENGDGWKVGWEVYWTGRQQLERNPYRSVAPSYWITGVMIERSWKVFRVFLNLENLTDTRQSRFDPTTYRVAGGFQRLVPVYAPLEGRVINGGVRFVF